MIYPANIEEKIGFNQIKDLLLRSCKSVMGAELVEAIEFETDFKKIQESLHITNEFLILRKKDFAIPIAHFHDIKPHLRVAAIEGSYLNPGAFLQIFQVLQGVEASLKFFERQKEDCPSTLARLSALETAPDIPEKIMKCIDDEGNIKDSASPELARIRTGMSRFQNQLRKVLSAIVKKATSEGFMPDGGNITIRDGRMVIPVLAEYKRRVKGFIHDESATGQTVYLEPAEALDINNELTSLRNAEKREEIKILVDLTNALRPSIPVLESYNTYLGWIDFWMAKAGLAFRLGAGLPKLIPNSELEWKKAYHPLLKIHFEKNKKQAVPLNVGLDSTHPLLLISGPNAGGKSVALKTVGLNQYMLQCGLLIPVDEDSTAGIFQSMFVDIGDEQSIENDLSTYSSHLYGMKIVLANANKNSIILFDEFGAGTDPKFGAAIGESILMSLIKKQCRGVITTHYDNLKNLAARESGIQNAAMRYSLDRLEPLFIMDTGKPGSSFALHIASKTGLGEDIIKEAKTILGAKEADSESLLAELEAQRNRVDQLEQELREKRTQLDQQLQEYKSKNSQIEKNQKAIIEASKSEARALLDQANRQIEKTIRQIKEHQAEKEATKEVRASLDQFRATLKTENPKRKQSNSNKPTFKVGEMVTIKDRDIQGQIIKIKGKKAEIRIGTAKSIIAIDQLESGNNHSKKQTLTRKIKGLDISQKSADFRTTLDLRGRRVSEALAMLDQWLDDALLLNNTHLKILHGKGDGILRKAIREQMGNYTFVSDFKDEHVEHGGAGITLVTLK